MSSFFFIDKEFSRSSTHGGYVDRRWKYALVVNCGLSVIRKTAGNSQGKNSGKKLAQSSTQVIHQFSTDRQQVASGEL